MLLRAQLDLQDAAATADQANRDLDTAKQAVAEALHARKRAIRAAHAEGMSIKEIMAITGLSRRSVYYAVEKNRRST